MQLFQKDLFSEKSPSFTRLNIPARSELTTIIRLNYPDLVINEIYQTGSFGINSNNWKIETDKEIFIFKRATINKLASLSAQAQWTTKLENRSFPTLRFLKNKDEKLISKDKEFVYCITYFEDGQYFGSSIEQWPELMRYLEKLIDHSLKNCTSGSLNFPAREFFSADEERLIAELNTFPEIDGLSGEEFSFILKEYEEVKSVFNNSKKKLTRGIFHTDIHPHNLIFKNNHLKLFTDFESFQFTTIEISLGFGLYKCMRELLTIGENHIEKQLQKVIDLLQDQFKKNFPGYNFKELIVLGKIDVLKRILYIIKELIENGRSQWLFILPTQLASMKEINKIENVLSKNLIY